MEIKFAIGTLIVANDAIADAVVSHETGTAVVTLAAEISDEALAQIVVDAGYKVIEVK